VKIALYSAIIIVSVALTFLVVVQGRTAGLQQRDTIYRTKRGIEKTMHQATIVLAVVFLLLALIASLPIW